MLTSDEKLFIAVAENNTASPHATPIYMNACMANRHGLISGATGTGKTVTVQNIAETFSAAGVPVFLTDIKGDLSSLTLSGQPSGGIARRIQELELEKQGYKNKEYPVCFWDVYGKQGLPLRTTISEMGPMLISRLLNLNDVQSGILNIIFHIADERGLLLLDFKDLRATVAWVSEHRADFCSKYGHIASASIAALQRSLLRMEDEGASHFFGEPALNLEDILRTDMNGRGYINILAADELMLHSHMYATVLLWLLSELYERLPERGDCSKPRLVMIFDEAHLIFKDIPSVLMEKVELTVRLIRSKGVGIFFATQNPTDIPASVLSQLGNRIQHALRVFTPQESKAVRAAASTFRANPNFKTEDVITQLRTGEALVSFLDEHGTPGVVERALILPPEGEMGSLATDIRCRVISQSPLYSLYGQMIDRESAYELLTAAAERQQKEAESMQKAVQLQKEQAARRKAALNEEKIRRSEERELRRREKEEQGVFDVLMNTAARSITTTVGRELGRSIIRGVLGGIFGGRR